MSPSRCVQRTSRLRDGQQIFRFDTFGDEAFWGDQLHLHQAIAGEKLGGVGPGVSPTTALAVGLKVDMDALPADIVGGIQSGAIKLNDPAVVSTLNDPATTLALLKLNAVVGLTGVFDQAGTLKSLGYSARYATPPWTMLSPRASGTAWTAGPTATST
jgi:hypothetical protein